MRFAPNALRMSRFELAVSSLALLALLLSGCIATQREEVARQEAPAVPVSDPGGIVDSIAHAADGALAPPAPALQEVVFRIAHTGFHRGEPTVGVTSSGAIFVPSGADVFGGTGHVVRSLDHGRTWEDVTDPVLGGKKDVDPWIYVDPVTDRVFNSPLWGVCSWLQWSDDDGDSWSANPLGGCGVPAHDHQKLAAGPPTDGVRTEGYPNVVYYAYNSIRGEGSWLSRSLDGGTTFDWGTVVHPQDGCHGGINGPVHASWTDGTVYLPKPVCDGVNVGVSEDSGTTWRIAEVARDVGVNRYLANPDVSTDTESNAYLLWPGDDALMYLAISRDRGQRWSEPIRVSPPGVTSTAFSVIEAGAPGRIAIAYLATDADNSGWKTPHAHDASPEAVWHLMVTFSENALDADPVFTTWRATPEDDPIQVGPIWLGGGTEPSRNLRDFMGMTVQGGRVYVSVADGCDRCTTAGESRGNEVTVAILEEGPSLLDPLTALRPLVVVG